MEVPKIRRATIQVNGVNIFYRETEIGEGGAGRRRQPHAEVDSVGRRRQCLLCLHGRWGRGETWVELMERLSKRFRIIAPDQRGHGLSDKPDTAYTAEEMAADAHELLAAFNCGPALVVGHSMGARIAAHLAVAFPRDVKALVLLDEGSGSPASFPNLPPEKIPDLDNFTADWPTPYASYEEAVRHLRGRFGRESNVRYFLESLTETVEGYDFMFSRRAMTAIGQAYKSWDHLLFSIECPVLLVRASNSWVLTREKAQEMTTMLKDCTYFEVTNSDHMVYADNPDEFYPQFEKFVCSV